MPQATVNALLVDQAGNAYTPNQAGGTATAASSGNVAAAAAVATIAANATKINYITALTITASGATAGLPVVATLTGLTGGTLSFVFTFPAGVLVGATPIVLSFGPPLVGSAINTAVVLTLPSGGAGNTNAAVSLTGYVL